jgi:hypothetical protein
VLEEGSLANAPSPVEDEERRFRPGEGLLQELQLFLTVHERRST